MSLSRYLDYLDELSDRERTIFLYCFVLKLPQSEAAKRLKTNSKTIRNICNHLLLEMEVSELCELLTKSYTLDSY